MEHKCYCRGDEESNQDLTKPEHLMPMMRPFSMRFLQLPLIVELCRVNIADSVETNKYIFALNS